MLPSLCIHWSKGVCLQNGINSPFAEIREWWLQDSSWTSCGSPYRRGLCFLHLFPCCALCVHGGQGDMCQHYQAFVWLLLYMLGVDLLLAFSFVIGECGQCPCRFSYSSALFGFGSFGIVLTDKMKVMWSWTCTGDLLVSVASDKAVKWSNSLDKPHASVILYLYDTTVVKMIKYFATI